MHRKITMRRKLLATMLLIGLTPSLALAAPNDAYEFAGASYVGNFNYHGSGPAMDFKGFRTVLFGLNQGGNTITWTATWYGCDTDPEFRSTTIQVSNAPAGSALADEAAVDAYLASHNCVALPSSGAKDTTLTAQTLLASKYSFVEFDQSGKAFATAKVTAAVAGETTGYTVLPGAVRPFSTSLPSYTISGTAISRQLGTFGQDYRNIAHGFYICDSAVIGEPDSSNYNFELVSTAANCEYVMGANGGFPTDLEELYVYSGSSLVEVNGDGKNLLLASAIDNTVFAWPNSTLITLSAPAPAPYTGPVLESFSTRSIDACQGTVVTITGARLDGITSATVQGKRSAVIENTADRLVIRTPAGLTAAANQSLVITSAAGTLTHQNAFNVVDSTESSVCALDTTKGYWTQWQAATDTIKIYAKNPIGSGKVQFFVDGREIAWVNAVDANDPKLRVITTDGPMAGVNYLVRTISLNPGKNRIEIRVDGQRVWRVTYLPRG